MPPNIQVGKPLPRHPLYDQQATARSFWRRSDRARWDYANGSDAAAQPILMKHEREDDPRYARRLAQAIARPYMRQILDRYNDFVFRTVATRDQAAAGTPYGQLVADADGAGTPLAVMVKRQERKAQTEGVAYLMADSNDPMVYGSKAAEMEAGKRPIIRPVSADQVLWWREWCGLTLEAVILFTDRKGTEFALYVNEEVIQKINLKPRENANDALTVESVDGPIAHTYGGCPLVPLRPVFGVDDDEDGLGYTSQGAPLAESVKRICNQESWHQEELQGCTFTTPVFLGVSAEQVAEVKVGPSMALAIPAPGASLDHLGADVAQAESLRTTLAHEISELYRAAGLASGNPTETAQPESGVAKAFAFNEVEAKLGALAQAAQSAENLAVRRLATGNGWATPAPAKYPADFSAPDLAAELDRVLATLNSDLATSIKRLEQTEYFARRFPNAKPEDRNAFTAELEQQLQQAEERRQIQEVQKSQQAGGNTGI